MGSGSAEGKLAAPLLENYQRVEDMQLKNS